MLGVRRPCRVKIEAFGDVQRLYVWEILKSEIEVEDVVVVCMSRRDSQAAH